MRHACVLSQFHLRSFRMACVHTVLRDHSPSRTAHDRRPAIISIKYATHCHGMHFPLFVNNYTFGDDRRIITSKCAIKNIETFLIFSPLHLLVRTVFLSRHCHYTSDLTYHIIPHISALILLIFHPLLKKRRRSCQCEHLRLITYEKILMNGDVPRRNGNVTYSVNRPLYLRLQRYSFKIIRWINTKIWQASYGTPVCPDSIHFNNNSKVKMTGALHRKTKAKTYSEAGNIALRQTL